MASRTPAVGAGPRRAEGTGAARRQLLFAAAGVLVAASDTYVVVVALPSIMGGVGIGLDHLQRATPVVSGFLLGYVAVLPLLGRLADLVGKRPVFIACLGAFAAGSVITASAHTLGLLVAGRALQGLGGGGLVPVTLALVAEHWPPERRGLPLGVVGAVQELGSVIGPLYGAAVVAVAGWRWIFWLNLPLAALVAVGYAASRPTPVDAAGSRPDGDGGGARRDVVGALLLGTGAVAGWLALAAPFGLATGVATRRLYAPVVDAATWATLTTPVAFAAGGLLTAWLAWELAAPSAVRPMLPLRHARAVVGRADLPGAVLLAGILGCVVVAFSTTDPGTQVVASSAVVLGPVAAGLLVAFVWRQRRAAHPLLAPSALRARPAWGAMLVNLMAGAALVAALVDVPLFARATTDPDSQLAAALVLLRFLAAVPVGAVAGGLVCRTPARGPFVAGGGLAVTAAAFASMTTWSASALASPLHLAGLALPFTASDAELVACGLGFGLAIAPVNAAVLGAVPARVHGLAGSLAVVARTVGMLVGISVLTAVALHRFYRAEARIGSPLTLCPTHPGSCPVYETATTAALLSELHTIFLGAAVAATVGAALSLVLLRAPTARNVTARAVTAPRRAAAP
jgi:MFS family permease